MFAGCIHDLARAIIVCTIVYRADPFGLQVQVFLLVCDKPDPASAGGRHSMGGGNVFLPVSR